MIDTHRVFRALQAALLAVTVASCDPLPTSTDAGVLEPSQAVQAAAFQVDGPFQRLTKERPKAINDRGWILSAFSLDDGDSVIPIAPNFWPQAMNQTTVVGTLPRARQVCATAGTLDPLSGVTQALATPAGYDAGMALAINAHGTVAGYAGRRNAAALCEIAHHEVAVWEGGAPRVLRSTVPGALGIAHGINDLGDVVGMSGTDATIWIDDQPVRIGRFGGRESRALAVNNRRLAVGYSETDDSMLLAFTWQDGAMTALPSLGGNTSFARAVNNRGLIVGSSTNDSHHERAVLWHSGEIIDLGTLGGSRSGAHAINERGEIAGWAEDSNGREHSVVWRVRGGR